MNVVIANDEPLALMRLASCLEKAGCNVVAKFQDGLSLARWLGENSLPDALFLDVKMPGATGLEILAEYEDRIPVVLVTSAPEFAVSAFDFSATDFLLKPLSLERLEKALGRIRSRILGRESKLPVPAVQKIPVIAGKGTVLLDIPKITHFELENGEVWVWAAGSRFQTRWRTLLEVETALAELTMVRLNRNILVRPEAVRGLQTLDYGRRMVRLSDGREFVASRRGSHKLEAVLGLG